MASASLATAAAAEAIPSEKRWSWMVRI